MRVLVFLATIGCLILWSFFFAQEWAQLKIAKFDYFLDYWNWIDMSSLSVNFLFLVLLNVDVMAGKQVISLVVIRTFGGLGSFFMWIKVFYWMRLFKQTAYFITLIK